jgi:hypothetical protein
VTRQTRRRASRPSANRGAEASRPRHCSFHDERKPVPKARNKQTWLWVNECAQATLPTDSRVKRQRVAVTSCSCLRLVALRACTGEPARQACRARGGDIVRFSAETEDRSASSALLGRREGSGEARARARAAWRVGTRTPVPVYWQQRRLATRSSEMTELAGRKVHMLLNTPLARHVD